MAFEQARGRIGRLLRPAAVLGFAYWILEALVFLLDRLGEWQLARDYAPAAATCLRGMKMPDSPAIVVGALVLGFLWLGGLVVWPDLKGWWDQQSNQPTTPNSKYPSLNPQTKDDGSELVGPYIMQTRPPSRSLKSALGKSDLTALQLISLCKERTRTEQHQIAEVYAGFSLEVTGTIFSMGVTSYAAVISVRVDGGRVGLVHANIARPDFIKKAAFLRENELVTVIGVVCSISDLDVVLEDCEFALVEGKSARKRT